MTEDAAESPTPERPRPARRSDRQEAGPRRVGWGRWLGEPRSAVLFVLVSVVVLGGGRRLLRAWRAREAVAKLEGKDVTAEAIAAAASHGRAGLFELFRLLGEAPTETLRRAAGRAIAVLWAADELIAEEEKALVRRGLRVDWKARKRYPRALSAEIPIAVHYRLPFLDDSGRGVRPTNLEWSHRIVGARRASLESPSPWTPGEGHAAFTIVPGDFETDGPHRLVLQAKVRTTGLTESWELELPHMLFSFEFDPLLAPEALLALPESTRAEAIARRVRLEPTSTADGDGLDAAPRFLELNDTIAVRNPPTLRIETPLPCDLAHAASLEIEGIEGRFPAGRVVLAGQGAPDTPAGTFEASPWGDRVAAPVPGLDRPGPRRLRAVLTPDPEIGWGDPDVRSLWPGTIITDWVDCEVVRR